MKFQDGDIVSGRGIGIGRIVGEETIDGAAYLKVFDLNKNANYDIPKDRLEDLRKLPSKNVAQNDLKMFDSLELVDDGELDSSRYKYLKSKLELVDFQKTIEVLHDLSVLKFKKEINSSERKLYNHLKEKVVVELAYILECEPDELDDVIELVKFSE